MIQQHKTIAIIHGINEGAGMSKGFRKACRLAGYSFTNDRINADILFTHSGGCLLIPTGAKARTVMLVGIAFWPDKPWLYSTKRHLRAETKYQLQDKAYAALIVKWLYRSVYVWKLRTTVKMGRNQNMEAAWNSSSTQIIIRNQYDEYCLPSIHEMPFRGPRTFISLPGSHDDCWDNPEPYVELLNRLQ